MRENYEVTRHKNLAVAVSFFYNIDKLKFLEKALSNLHLFADTVSVYIFALRSKISDDNIKKCQSKYSNIKYTILYQKLIGHPYFLTWSHQEIFKHLALRNREITHYLYIKDDIQLNVENIEYYIEGKNNLLKHKFIPSFVRYEVLDGVMYSIDIMKKQIFNCMPYIKNSDSYFYINLSYPYQGMYLLPQRYMYEYFSSKVYNPDYNTFWPIREMATATISFHHIPKGFKSRNLVGCIKNNDKINFDSRALIYHLPDKYVKNKDNLKKLTEIDKIII